jgi:hypothetical protein
MTEDEATRKWCPFSNVNIPYQNTGAGGNRGHFSEVGQFQERYTRCIGSGCMAWRLTDLVEVPSGTPGAVLVPNMGHRWFAPQQGYCGLAGKP